ncbi:MAG: hypothetical protein JW915_11180 [Chitinispirillaceae bacterium]|nr:hypothetical protein [Chitinispirillaceae bacterium]
MRSEEIKNLVIEYRGIDEYQKYANYRMDDFDLIMNTYKEMMSQVPPRVGDCAHISAAFAQELKEKDSIPAIVVAGDFKLNGQQVFTCKGNIPETPANEMNEGLINSVWEGHCWVEIDDCICDISIFRTAYSLPPTNFLNSFITNNFGKGRGAFAADANDLPNGMQYIPKYVLNDNQIGNLSKFINIVREEFAKFSA